MKNLLAFRDNSLANLLYECDQKVNLFREKVERGYITDKITINGLYALVPNNKILDSVVTSAIRQTDAVTYENQYASNQLGSKIKYIDIEVRNIHKGVLAAKLKCISRFNYHRIRNFTINKDLTKIECPQCRQVEDWDYIVQCKGLGV